ncbi:cysteine proteinase [Trichodelitschia bisporula]|uniref:Ubiquitin carboxyl-terminal hydrolase n=1 Tax=Trichodelitschia bisporula TaxID=703511 RepID=A0A6G1I6G1_9PEZI|nr:cysteine proteinase [Trichodelitschia bisporula]
MASLFNRFKPTAGASGPNAANTPAKKDPNAPQPTPLERLLADAGPIRHDGSDKFFGFENFGSTCYCNSIIQCLYHSAPFREQVINFPTRSPPESLRRDHVLNAYPLPDNHHTPLSPVKSRAGLTSPNPTASPRSKQPPPSLNPNAPAKPEENKDSPDYKKKLALTTGPILNMDYANAPSYGMEESLFSGMKDIFEAMIAHDSRTGVVSPSKFLETLRRENEMFRTPMHQDAHEFLNLVLNQVVENVEQFSKSKEEEGHAPHNGVVSNGTMTNGIAKPQSSRWVHELFEGTLTSETRCLTCENVSQRDEAFLDLSVDLEQHSSVTSCLRKFSEEEMLCERNKFHCDKCGGLQEAEKRMKIKRLPRILALHLKRFKYTEDLQRLQKLFHRVVYPYYLRLFNTTDDAEDPDRLYELYAVVVHIGGGPYHGHYVSIIKTQDRGWVLFDDEMVEPVDKSYVRNYFGGEQNLACAYVLFYQETTLEAMQREQEAEGFAAAPAAATATADKEKDKDAKGVNGTVLNGHVVPPTPAADEVDFVGLDHVATAPPGLGTSAPPTPQTPMPLVFETPLPPSPAPVVPGLQFLNRKKSTVVGKGEKSEEKDRRKEAEKEEKERKKEAEREEKERRKEAERGEKERKKEAEREEKERKKEAEREAERRRAGKRRKDDPLPPLPPLPALPPTPGPDKGGSLGGFSASGGSGSSKDSESKRGSSAEDKLRGKENGFLGGGLQRFRQTSMSLRAKPRFWGGKDKENKDKEKGKRDKEREREVERERREAAHVVRQNHVRPSHDETHETDADDGGGLGLTFFSPPTPTSTPSEATEEHSSTESGTTALPVAPKGMHRAMSAAGGEKGGKLRTRFSLSRKKSVMGIGF